MSEQAKPRQLSRRVVLGATAIGAAGVAAGLAVGPTATMVVQPNFEEIRLDKYQ
jgi:hypothetical protein